MLLLLAPIYIINFLITFISIHEALHLIYTPSRLFGRLYLTLLDNPFLDFKRDFRKDNDTQFSFPFVKKFGNEEHPSIDGKRLIVANCIGEWFLHPKAFGD